MKTFFQFTILKIFQIDDKELSGAEEEKEVEKALLKPLLSLEDLVRFSSLEGGGGESLRALLQRGQESAEWSAFEHSAIGPYIQKMLAAAAPFKGKHFDIDFCFLFCSRLACSNKKLAKRTKHFLIMKIK